MKRHRQSVLAGLFFILLLTNASIAHSDDTGNNENNTRQPKLLLPTGHSVAPETETPADKPTAPPPADEPDVSAKPPDNQPKLALPTGHTDKPANEPPPVAEPVVLPENETDNPTVEDATPEPELTLPVLDQTNVAPPIPEPRPKPEPRPEVEPIPEPPKPDETAPATGMVDRPRNRLLGTAHALFWTGIALGNISIAAGARASDLGSNCYPSDCDASRRTAGLMWTTMFSGMVLTTVGIVLFAKNRKRKRARLAKTGLALHPVVSTQQVSLTLSKVW